MHKTAVLQLMAPLLDIIKKITPLDEKDIAACSNAFEEIHIPKQSLLHTEQTIPRYLYFIMTGYMRMFYVDSDDRERTTLLCGPGDFITPFLPFIHEQTAQENLASITDCNGLKISRNDLAALISKSEPFKAFSLVIFEQALKEANQRANDLANMQGYQRYKKFVENKPENNAESIFEVQYLAGPNGPQSNFAYQFMPALTNTITITGSPGNGNNQQTGGWNTPSFDLLAAYEPGDLRKSATIDSGYIDPAIGNFVAQPFCKKYLHPPYAVYNNTGDDWMVFRYADVLLLLAECLNEESKTTQAIPLLNQVRARAGLAAMTAYGIKMKQLYSYIQPNAYNVTQTRLIFPIPQSEMDINSLLVQNPGY